jgi:hypothetical protein
LNILEIFSSDTKFTQKLSKYVYTGNAILTAAQHIFCKAVNIYELFFFFSILKTLLSDLIERSIDGKREPKLLFRR